MSFSKLFLSARSVPQALSGSVVGRRSFISGKEDKPGCAPPPLAKCSANNDVGNMLPPVADPAGSCSNLGASAVGDSDHNLGERSAVVGVFHAGELLELTPAAAELDQTCGGKIMQHLNSTVLKELALGKAFLMTDIPEYKAVALASYGPPAAGYNHLENLYENRENVRWGVGAGLGLLRERGFGEVAVDGGGEPDAAGEAAELAVWRFEEFKSQKSPQTRVRLLGPDQDPRWQEGALRGRAQNWARWLSDMPANKMTPVHLAQAALDTLCPLGVTVRVHDRAWLAAQGMEAFLAVARGSCESPLMLECEYKGAAGPPVVIAAKGVTFDSGGLCLKTQAAMRENRGSMAGAAVSLAALKAIAELKVPINVVCVIPLCENMISGQCMKVGDVVRALNGLSIAIEHTDMEGRLMLADALVYAQARHRPAAVIDVATLTHGIQLATGGGACGAFSNSEDLWEMFRAAGAVTGDRAWRFPLWQYYTRQITNDPAVDLRNKGSGKATPCIGAAFLQKFVCTDWLHIDTTGVGKVAALGAGPPYLSARRMTGRPARTLVAALQALAEQRAQRKDEASQ